MLLLHHSRNLTPAVHVKGANISTSNFLQAFSLCSNGAQKKASDLTGKPDDGCAETLLGFVFKAISTGFLPFSIAQFI